MNHRHGCEGEDDYEKNMIHVIHHHRNDRHFAEFLFEIFLYEIAASIPASKPTIQVRLDLIVYSAKLAREIILDHDSDHNADNPKNPLVYDMWIATAPYAPTPIDLYLYLKDPWRPTRLFKREINIDTTQTKIAKFPTFFTLPALTKEDHDHFERTYAKIEPDFQERFALAVSFCRDHAWGHDGSGGHEASYDGSHIWSVDKYTRQHNSRLRERWANEAAAALTAEEALPLPSISVASSSEGSSGTMSKAAAKKAKKKAKKANEKTDEKADENNNDPKDEGQVLIQPVFGEAYDTALRLRNKFALEMKQAQTGKRREDYDHDELMRLSLGWFKHHIFVVGTHMAVFNSRESTRREKLEEARQHAVSTYKERVQNIEAFSQQFNSSQVALRISLERLSRNLRKNTPSISYQKLLSLVTTEKTKNSPVAQPTPAVTQSLNDVKNVKATSVQTTAAKPTPTKPSSTSTATPTRTPVPTTLLPQRTSAQIKKCEGRVRELDLFLDKYTDLLANKRLTTTFPNQSRIFVMAGYKSDARKKILQEWTPSLRLRGNIDRFLDLQVKENHLTPHEAYRLSVSLEDTTAEKARRAPMGASTIVKALVNSLAGDWPSELPADLYSLDSDTDKKSTVSFAFKVSYDSYYGGIDSDDGSVPDAEWETDNDSVPDAESQTEDEEETQLETPLETDPELASAVPSSTAASAAFEEDFAAEQDRTMGIRHVSESFAERSKLMEQDEFSMASLHFLAEEDDASEYSSTGSIIGSDSESMDGSDSEFEGGIDEHADDMDGVFAGVPVASKLGYLVDSRRAQERREWLETISQRRRTPHSLDSNDLPTSLEELYDGSSDDDEDEDYQYESDDSEGSSQSGNSQDDDESDMETEISAKELEFVLTFSKPGLYDGEMLDYLELCHQEFLQMQWNDYSERRNQDPESTLKAVKENQRRLLERAIGLEVAAEEEQRLEREQEAQRLAEEQAKRDHLAEITRLAMEALQAKKKAAAEEAAAKKKAAAEVAAAKKKAAAEEAAAKKKAAAEEAAAKKKAAAEEAVAKKKAAAEEEDRSANMKSAAATALALAEEAARATAEDQSTKMVREEAAAQATAILAGAGLGCKETPEPRTRSHFLNILLENQDHDQIFSKAAAIEADSTTPIGTPPIGTPPSSQKDSELKPNLLVSKAETVPPRAADILTQEELRLIEEKLKEDHEALSQFIVLEKQRLKVEAERLALEASFSQGEPMKVLNDKALYYDWRGINLSLSLWRSPHDHFSAFELWVDHWYSQLRPSTDSNKLREGLLIRLQSIFEKEFPGKNLALRPFGSFITGLGNTWSDIDICIFSLTPGPLETYADVSNLAWMLRKYGMENIVAITDAKVPIVKFVDPETNIACDMNVQKPLGIYNSQLIRAYLDIDERLGKFIYLLKYFAKAHGILDGSTGFLCSYAFILMAIVFFQEQELPILPRLQVWQERPMSADDLKRLRRGLPINNHRSGKTNSTPATFAQALRDGTVSTDYVGQDGKMFDVSFDQRIALYRKNPIGSLNKKTVSQLLFEFFQYFSRQYDYRTMEVSSKHGRVQERHALDKEKKLQIGRQLKTGIPSTTSSTLAPGTKGQYVYDQQRRAWLSGDELAYFKDLEANGGQPSGRVPEPGFFRPTTKASEEAALSSTSSSGSTTGGRNQDGVSYGGPITDESFLCVMDPFIYNRNAAGTCRGERLGKVWRCFDHAYKCFALGKFADAFQPLTSGE